MNERPREDIEEILDRFRLWLQEARDEAHALSADDSHAIAQWDGSAEGASPEFGLINLIEEFTALRHELKLQTKSGRSLIEQGESTVAALRQAIDHFRSVEPKEAQAVWTAGRPIAEALGDLDEALARGRRELERIRHRLEEDATLAMADAIDERFRRQSWLRRLLTADFHRQVRNVVHGRGWLRPDMLDALLEGYGLIQSRLARVMTAERIERIPCEGHPVDPERMTVLEVIDDPDRPPGTVLKELRSGYTWKGRLVRYAEVQAASAASGANLAGAPGPDVDAEFDGSGPEDAYHDLDENMDQFDEDDHGVDLDINTSSPGPPQAR
jgi:molecular chaperone GrpE